MISNVMTSITKHQYDIPKTNCANKENESSNGKRSEVTKSSSGIDSNFDWAKREAISQQRKLRLIEVSSVVILNCMNILYKLVLMIVYIFRY